MTNEKTLLTRAGLGWLDKVFAEARPDPECLLDTDDQVHRLCATSVKIATAEELVLTDQ